MLKKWRNIPPIFDALSRPAFTFIVLVSTGLYQIKDQITQHFEKKYPIYFNETLFDSLFPPTHKEQKHSFNSRFNTYSNPINKLNKIKWTPAPVNPDTLSELHWIEMGLSEKQAKAVMTQKKYRGGFHSFEQLAQIPFIPDNLKNDLKKNAVFQNPSENQIKPEAISIDINKADSISLLSVKGLGPKSVSIILKWREQFGGLHTIEQLFSLPGIDTARLHKIQTQTHFGEFEPFSLKINRISKEELNQFPWLPIKWTRSLLFEKSKNGPFIQLDDLKSRVPIEDSILMLIIPYLDFL
jgi:DNA uptake protein ComE-like DNA-binding protein